MTASSETTSPVCHLTLPLEACAARLISALMATDMALVPIIKCVSGTFTIYSNNGTQTIEPPPPVRARRNPTIPPVTTNSITI